MSTERQLLEELIVDNPDLEKLEELLRPFNFFEATGATSRELRHSTFLGFLLDPHQSHGLGDRFLLRFLWMAIRRASSDCRPVSLLDLDLYEWDDLEVRREWQGIDILLISPSNGLVVIIENKIHSEEHSDQLRRYWHEVERRRLSPTIVGLYLSPGGSTPSDERYIGVPYGSVCDVLDAILEREGSLIGDPVKMALQQYSQLLRRHVVSTTEIAELAQKIYRKHRRAMDLIIEHRPDTQSEISEFLTNMVMEQGKFELEHATKGQVRFSVPAWDRTVPVAGDGTWCKSRRLLAFEFQNGTQRLSLGLYIGPGSVSERQDIFERVRSLGSPFKPSQTKLAKSWNMIWQAQFLSRPDLEGDKADAVQKIRTEWENFLALDFPRLAEVFESWPPRT